MVSVVPGLNSWPEVLRVTRCSRCDMIFTNPRSPAQDIERHYFNLELGDSSQINDKIDAARRVVSFPRLKRPPRASWTPAAVWE
jgi:hypothetical protein